jgi:SAM-dependent methyltransferase
VKLTDALTHSVTRTNTESETPLALQRIYKKRFTGLESYRNEVWGVLVSKFFRQWINPDHTVLDLGCGYGEFINNIPAATKYAMDLNPTAQERLASDITLFQQDCSRLWPLPDHCLDIIFTSNFFEHLPSKAALLETLLEARRCLKPGGRLLAMGPNVRYLSGAYWDFFDHHLALTELSLAEALEMTGYRIDLALAKFLPYSMSQGFRPPIWTLHLFLNMPVLWRLFGRQFLVIGTKPA